MNPIRLATLTQEDVERCLRGDGLCLHVASFRCLIRSNTGLLSSPFKMLYQDYLVETSITGFFDFCIRLKKVRKNFWSPWEVEFDWEGNSPFPPLLLAHTHPLFEWGLNWCVATASGLEIVIHSAVVERDGIALVFPGQAGSGKSTLCANCVSSGICRLRCAWTISCSIITKSIAGSCSCICSRIWSLRQIRICICS